MNIADNNISYYYNEVIFSFSVLPNSPPQLISNELNTPINNLDTSLFAY